MSGISPLTETISSAVNRSGLSRSTLYNLMRDGSLESRKVRGRRLIVSDSLRSMLLEQAA